MSSLDAVAFSVLHEIRLVGALPVDDTEPVVRLVDAGYVVRSARGVRVTSVGREIHARWARLEPGSDSEQAVQRVYERFLPLNRELIRICHDWQVRSGGAPNDHRDRRYDWGVLDRLRALDERAAPLVNRAGRTVERFASYRARLRAAVARIDEGEHEWLTSPRVDSYHTVWMQLHEDLLLALGRERAAEAQD